MPQSLDATARASRPRIVAGVAAGTTVLLAASTLAAVSAQADSPQPQTVTASTNSLVVDRTLRDASLSPRGLAVDPRVPGRVLTADVSTGTPQVLAIGPDGQTQARWRLKGARAAQVTDIARGRGRHVWVGDIGDRKHRRGEVSVFSAALPTDTVSRPVAWSRFRLRYPAGHPDAQALLVSPRTGRLYVVTHTAGPGAVYVAPSALSHTRVNLLRRVSSAPAGVSGGEFSATGDSIVLLHAGQVSTGTGFAHLTRTETLPKMSATGYVAFSDGDQSLLLGARRARAELLRVTLTSTASSQTTPSTSATTAPVPVPVPVPAAAATPTPTPSPAAPPVGPLAVVNAVTSGQLGQLGWQAVQEPRPESIQFLDPSFAPTLTAAANPGPVMRVELRDGETVTTSGYTAHQSEVYGRNPAGTWSGTPSSQWPDPPGSTRWYDFSVYVPADFVLATDSRWLDFTQWKGYRGGSPPIALELHRSEFRLGGSRLARSLGTVNRGAWTRFTVGLHFATSSSEGWVQVYRNGTLALAKTSVATMDLVNGAADSVYLKQGIYRSSVWHTDQVLYFSPMRVTTDSPIS